MILQFIVQGYELVQKGESQDFPAWLIPFGVVYIVGVIITAKVVSRSEEKGGVWKKVLFTIFWPFTVFIFALRINQWMSDG